MLVTVREAAQRMSVSTKTIYRLFNRGKLTKMKVGRATRISADELNVYLKSIGLKEVRP